MYEGVKELEKKLGFLLFVWERVFKGLAEVILRFKFYFLTG
jgi:hypothetical protein